MNAHDTGLDMLRRNQLSVTEDGNLDTCAANINDRSGSLYHFLESCFAGNRLITDEPMLEVMFAIALPAFGSAILFNIGASSGGTDIIAMIVKKYSSINIGKALIVSDIAITVLGFFVFGMKTGLYSLFGLSIRSFLVDNFIESLNLSKYFNVVCAKPDPICDFIVNQLHRGATICDARGAFSGSEKYIILTALNRQQAIKLRNFIKKEDPSAFILISNTSEIIGKGFHAIYHLFYLLFQQLSRLQ